MRRLLTACALALAAGVSVHAAVQRPNVVLIICDDLNDYEAGMGGHPQAHTPNLTRLMRSGVTFQHNYANNPVCAPSRASFLTGIYPHTSKNFFWDKWFENPVLKNSKSLFEYFHDNGYYVAGSGKLFHHELPKIYDKFKYKADYGPFAFDGKERVGHPSVPEPFRSIGAVDGSFAPLSDVPFRGGTNNAGWIYGDWGATKPLRYVSETDRDPTPDERNAAWAAGRIQQFAAEKNGKPFLLAVGFIRPHTPLHVPKKYYDLFPLESVQLPVIKPGDAADCHYLDVFDDTMKGPKYFRLLKESYPTTEAGLRAFVQAYLASVAAVDDCIGQVMAAVDKSPFKDNTIIVVTADNGWQMGQKDYLFKNALWEEASRVPLIIRAPGISAPGGVAEHPVSLIDLYPTLADLCGLKGDTRKNEQGAALDGHSLRPLLADPKHGKWSGPNGALTMIFAGEESDKSASKSKDKAKAKTKSAVSGSKTDPTKQHWSLRTERWRYTLYNNGAEELYDHAADPHEWNNLAELPQHAAAKQDLKKQMQDMIAPAKKDKPAATAK